MAFSALLSNIPKDAPLAAVLVQHLSPNHESMLPTLLGAKTALKVVTANDRMPIQPGHVYVIPPDRVMTVSDGRLSIHPRAPNGSGGPGPVDALFLSVAEQYQDRGVGVILSGSGHDGAHGIRAIKDAGGITLCQTAAEAEIDGMPHAAIATGAVDAVLPVAEIAEQLMRLAAHPFFHRAPGDAEEADLDPKHPSGEADRRRVFQLLRRATGVDFHHYKSPTITRRIYRRMALHRLSSLAGYVRRLERDPDELARLQEDLLIHVTSFFREPDSFEALAHHVATAISGGSRETPFRVWVPGCSTGEEAYSLAIILNEVLGEKAGAVPIQLFGTDVSEVTIERARAGIYPATIRSDVSPQRLRRFFTPFDGGYRINKVVRDCCVFARQDVTRDPPFSKLDVIVCRNLLIYLTQATQRKVMAVFHYALNPGGVLMLGRSETIGPNADLFAVVDKRLQLYRRKHGRARMELDLEPPSTESKALMSRDLPSKLARTTTEWDPQTDANRLLLDRYAPVAVIVDGEMRIVRTRGSTAGYLELPTGDVTFDILRMIRPELLFAMRAVLQEARTQAKPAVREGLKVKRDGATRSLTLHAIPLGGQEARQYLVLFEELSGTGAKASPTRTARARTKEPLPPRGAMKELRQELDETRQQLQAIIDDLGAANEALQAANEEVLSSNEELQSTNEELDTAKEELQSTNEELSTLNDELHGRNEELSRVNSDLMNLLNSVQIPIVMVSQDLKIRRFTPAAEKVLNIIPSDVGRPIGHLKPNFPCPDLDRLIAEVIDSVAIHNREVVGYDGRVFALQIRPYKSVENRIDGAVLSLFDISIARTHEAMLAAAKESAAVVIATVSEPILVLGDGLQIERANAAFLQRFKLTAGEVDGRSVYAMGGDDWNRPQLRQLLEETLPAQREVKGVTLEGDLPRVGKQRLLLDGRRIDTGPTGTAMTVLVIREGGDNAT